MNTAQWAALAGMLLVGFTAVGGLLCLLRGPGDESVDAWERRQW